MKKKILSLLAAFFMLFGTSAMAQVDSTLEGDVNEDGVVDVADIAAVIQIMKETQGTTEYYFHIWKEPSTTVVKSINNSGATYVSNNFSKYAEIPVGASTIELEDGATAGINTQVQILAPVNWDTFTIRDERDLGDLFAIKNGTITAGHQITSIGDININGVIYRIYRTSSYYRGESIIIKK